VSQPAYTFTRNSIAYTPDGTVVGVNEPRIVLRDGRKGILIEEGTTNMIEQYEPGASQDWSKWDHWVRVPSYWQTCEQYDDPTWGKVFYGKANKAEIEQITALWNYSHTISVTAGRVYTFSIYAKTSQTKTLQFEFFLTYGNNYRNSFITQFKTLTMESNTWYRVEISLTSPESRTDAQYGLRIYDHDVGQEFWFAYPQLEAKPYATSFINGTRTGEFLTIPTENVFNPSEGEISVWMYVNDVYRQTTPYPRVFHIGTSSNDDGGYLLLFRHHGSNNLNIQYTTSSGTVFEQSIVSMSSLTNGWHMFTVTWGDFGVRAYVDGQLKIQNSAKLHPTNYSSVLRIGHRGDNTRFANTLFDSVRISNKARTDEEILASYLSGLPLRVDQYTTYKLDFYEKVKIYSNGKLETTEIIEQDTRLPSSSTFVRNSGAYQSDGTYVTTNQPRFEQGKFGKALLIEEGTTNLIDQYEPGASQDWSKWSHWNNASYWYQTSQYDDPTWGKVFYGKAKASTYVFNYSPYISVTNGTSYTFSIWVKTSTTKTMDITFYLCYGNTVANSFASQTKSFPLIADTWTYLTFTVTSNQTRNDAQYGFRLVNASDQQEFWFAYPQLEAKSYETSFINGTRQPEALYIPSTVLSPLEATVEMWVASRDTTSTRRDLFTVNAPVSTDSRIVFGYNTS